MDPLTAAELVAEAGLLGNANQGGRRQVTVISAEAWERATAELGRRVEPAARRANLMVRGLELRETRDRTLVVGSCRILVGGETRPCNRMDEAAQGLQEALRPGWRGGVYGRVVEGGPIRVGDPVGWLE
jgi:MOSC domain-containing protein YiiM